MPFGINVPFVDIKKSAGTGVPFIDFDHNNPTPQSEMGGSYDPNAQANATAAAQALANSGGQSGAYSGGSGASGGRSSADIQADLAYLDEQAGMLRSMLARSGNTLNNGITQINDDFNKRTTQANQDRSFANEKFTNQLTDTTKGQQSALGKVDTNARTLANSVRQRIGRASGSGSSAYQITAPDAITREASQDRTEVQENFGQNFRDIDVSKRQAETEFERYLSELADKRKMAESGLREGVLSEEQRIHGNLADIERQKAAARGGGYSQIRAAGANNVAEANSRQSQIDQLFNQYRTPFNDVKGVTVNNPQLRDYAVNSAAIGGNQAVTADTGAYRNPFGIREDEKDKLY